MEHSDSAPDERKSLRPSGTLLSKHRGIALIFIFCTGRYPHFADFATVATFATVTPGEDHQKLIVYAMHGASDALQKVYNVDIRGTSIKHYHTQAVCRAQDEGFEWDKYAVAHIIRSQVDDEAAFKEVVDFLATYRDDERLEKGTRWLMERASYALDADDFPSYGDTTTKGRPEIKDPVLQQSFEEKAPANDDDNKAGAKALERSPPALPPPEDPWHQSNHSWMQPF